MFVVDDHELVRQGLRALIEPEPDMEVVGEADSAATALARMAGVTADVAVLDVRLPDGNGVEVCREIRSIYPDVACLMLTSFADDEALLASILAGAAGYVLKEVRSSSLIDDIRVVAGGGSLVDAGLAAKVIDRLQHPPEEDRRLASLTEQERRILDHLALGQTNRQIAAEMFLAEKTVKNYVSNLLLKLGMKRRTEAAVFAVRLEEGRSTSE